MDQILNEILNYFLGRYFGPGEIVVAVIVAFAFWCAEYGVVETMALRRTSGALCLVVAAAILIPIARIEWEPGVFWRIVLLGTLLWSPSLVIRYQRARKRISR